LAVDQAMDLHGSRYSEKILLMLSDFDTKNVKLNTRFDEQVAILDNSPSRVSQLLLHAFEPIVVVADEKDSIR
jgi:hypothetical protein